MHLLKEPQTLQVSRTQRAGLELTGPGAHPWADWPPPLPLSTSQLRSHSHPQVLLQHISALLLHPALFQCHSTQSCSAAQELSCERRDTALEPLPSTCPGRGSVGTAWPQETSLDVPAQRRSQVSCKAEPHHETTRQEMSPKI